MKKVFLLPVIIATLGLSSGLVWAEDTAPSTPQYVTSDDLETLLQVIGSKLEQLDKLKTLERVKHKLDNISILTDNLEQKEASGRLAASDPNGDSASADPGSSEPAAETLYWASWLQQELKTHSVYDANQDDRLTISDATTVISQVPSSQETAPVTPRYVTTEDLLALLQKINNDLESLDQLEQLENLELQYQRVASSIENSASQRELFFPKELFTRYRGHEYVDLGLRDVAGNPIYWATCNIGADTPQAFGSYFAWGETTTKNKYKWSNYKYCKGTENTLTKYSQIDQNTNYGYDGYTDTLKLIVPEDDAATVIWGGDWRMPTKAEQDDLRTKCTWTWTTMEDVTGYQVVGPNGNSIFLPAAGYYSDESTEGLKDAGSWGYYWSSTLHSNSTYGESLGFKQDKRYSLNNYRMKGLTIRPVCK